jgi:DNA-binding LytR/AlgR family response regulator
MPFSCIILDDEPIARKGLAGYVEKVAFLNLVGSFPDALSAMDTIRDNSDALLLLDINMPHLTGIDMLKVLPQRPPTVIISAYAEHAIEGYELDVIDYIVKPVSFERFLKAVTKARSYMEAVRGGAAQADHFFIKVDHRIERINMQDVLYIESLQNYVAVHTTQKRYISLITLKSLESFLPADRFVKVQKSFIVHTEKIQSIEGDEIVLPGKRITLSRANREDILRTLLGDRFIKRGS